MTVTNNLAAISSAFMGVSTLYYNTVSAALTSDMTWEYEFPILRDSINFNQGQASKNKAYIHGKAAAYATTKGEPGEITLEFFVPSVSEAVNKAFLVEGTSTPASIAIDASSSWVPVGKGLSFAEKALKGMVMIVNEAEDAALVIKNLEGFASLQADAITTKPIGYQLSMSVSGINANDPDGDVVFYRKSVA